MRIFISKNISPPPSPFLHEFSRLNLKRCRNLRSFRIFENSSRNTIARYIFIFIFCLFTMRTPCLFISWLRKTVYSRSCCLSSPQLSSSDVPRSSLVDNHIFNLILPWIVLRCVLASSLYHRSSPVLGISWQQTIRSYPTGVRTKEGKKKKWTKNENCNFGS